MGNIVVGPSRDVDWMPFFDRYMQQSRQRRADEEQKRQFDMTYDLQKESATAQSGYYGAQAKQADQNTVKERAMAKLEDFKNRIYDPLVKNNRVEEAERKRIELVNTDPDVQMFQTLATRESLPSDVASGNTQQYAAQQTALAAGGSPDAQAQNFTFKQATGEQMQPPVFADQQQRQGPPRSYKEFLERRGGARTTAAEDQQAAIAREQIASSERIAKSGASVKGDKVEFTHERNLRTEYLKSVKNFPELKDQIARINEASQDPSGQGDIALLFNFMKMLDPSSVVRESEYATAQNAGSLAERVGATLNSVRNGQRLTESQRKEFADVANRLYQAVAPRYEQIATEYTKLAQQYGLDPTRVVSGIGETQGTTRRRVYDQATGQFTDK